MTAFLVSLSYSTKIRSPHRSPKRSLSQEEEAELVNVGTNAIRKFIKDAKTTVTPRSTANSDSVDKLEERYFNGLKALAPEEGKAAATKFVRRLEDADLIERRGKK